MRVDTIKNVTQAYGVQTQGVPNAKVARPKDEVNLSAKACDFQYAYKLAKQVPDTRQEKIDAIKASIQTGTYTVDAKKVSEKIIGQIDIQG